MDTKRPSLKLVKQILALVDKHKLDSFSIPGLTLTKSRHSIAEKQPLAQNMGQGILTSVEEIDAQIMKDLGLS